MRNDFRDQGLWLCLTASLLLPSMLASQSMLYRWNGGVSAAGRGGDVGGGGGDLLGSSVDCAGDANGDGCPDVVVGSPLGGGGGQGLVSVFSGKTGALLWSVYGKQSGQKEGPFGGYIEDGERLGSTVRGIGDLNNDGYDDIYAAAPRYKDPDDIIPFPIDWDLPPIGHPARGRRFFLSGLDGSELKILDYLGVIEPAGDWNGDGHADYLRATGDRVVVASGKDFSVLHQFSVSGASLCLMGDVNLDGFADVLVGHSKWYKPNVGADYGRIVLYSGKDGIELLVIEGENSGDLLVV